MEEYLCYYDNDFITIYCIKTIANSYGEAIDKFQKYLSSNIGRHVHGDEFYVTKISNIETI